MQNPPRHKRTSQAGISLIELLISMIIMAIVSTMLVGAWISLQRSYAFAAAENKATGTARDALDRVASEIRDAQGITFSPSATPVPTTSTPFYLTGASPYVCDGYSCTFYSAYNNPGAALQSGQYGRGKLHLTAIWLDTSGAQKQKTLYWQRDMADDGFANDRKVVLATNVVNTATTVDKLLFTYNFRNAGVYSSSTKLSPSLTAGNVSSLVSVQVDVIVDANLSHTPKYIDLKTTVQPRNQITP